MLLRISWGKVRPGLWEGYEQEFRRFAARPIDGLLGNWLGRDVGDPDSIYTVTLWRDADALKAWESSPLRKERSAILRRYLDGAYSFSISDVSYGGDGFQPSPKERK